jgi:hypothetical protein
MFVASLIVAAIAGLLLVAADRAGVGRAGSIEPGLAIALAVLFVVAMAAANWLYLKDADELVWAHHYSSSFWALCFLVVSYPVWLLLWFGGIAPKPDAELIWGATLSCAVVVYLWKRAAAAFGNSYK